MKLLFIIFSTLSLTPYLVSQLPITNIVAFDYTIANNKIEVTNPTFLSSFNTDGYNNQPYFTNSDELLITSSYKAKGKTDIFLLNTAGNIIKRITATEQSEYSPVLNTDGTISVVREELGNASPTLQYLWRYPADRSNFGKRTLEKYANIGYYCWLPNQKVALFLVGERNKLIIVDIESGEETFISYNIGRCLRYDQNGGLLYVQKLGSAWTLRRQDLTDDISQYITSMPKNTEDFELLPNGNIISSDGGKLKYLDPNNSSEWSTIKDLTTLGIKNISRIARSGKKIAIVVSN